MSIVTSTNYSVILTTKENKVFLLSLKIMDIGTFSNGSMSNFSQVYSEMIILSRVGD